VNSERPKGYLHALPTASIERDVYDRYWTPCYVTEALLDRVEFEGNVWEPACGEGHIVHVLKARGYEVKATDITTGDDFLKSNEKADNIVTNPPYGLVNEFIEHALALARKKVAFMCRLHVLVSKGRHALFKTVPHVHILIFVTPIMQPTPEGGWKKGSAFTHCWVVIDLEGPMRENTFEWVEFDTHSPCDPI
jgi:hypothetical protein